MNYPSPEEMESTIFCILPGGGDPFSVEIPETQTVGELKDVIEAKQRLDTVASELSLYRVNIDASDMQKAIAEAEERFQDLSTSEHVVFLNATKRLSTVFEPTGPH